ncbi:MAG: YncE family protein, partial [Lentisphaeria bacterium]
MIDRKSRGGIKSEMLRSALLCITISCLVEMGSLDAAETSVYRSPFEVGFSPEGQQLMVSDRTAGMLVVVDLATGKVLKEKSTANQPTGMVLGASGNHVFVSEYASETVVEANATNGQLIRRIFVGHGPMGLAVAAKKNLLIVCNSSSNDVSLVDITGGKEKTRIPVVRQPTSVAVTPDETLALVSNLLPLGDATDQQTSACVSLIDLDGLKKITDIRLPAGSTNCRQIAISSDSRWAY